ncbi:MAG: ATP-binding protein [Candidatus Alcyoniella australis]|nr:ATP-binding protein [Candidatus Alcyoniella australis]
MGLGFRNWKFENKLIVMVLCLALLPLVTYALFSLNSFRQSSIEQAERDLEHVVKSLLMLCEAQEALDRIRVGGNVDAVTGASPAWHDGNEFKSLRTIIEDLKVAETGYCYVFDSSGQIVIHPLLEGQNIFQLGEEGSQHFLEMRDEALTLPVSSVAINRYPWPDPVSGHTTLKIAKFGYFEPYDWVIVAAAFEDEVVEPYTASLKVLSIVLLCVTVVIVLLVFTLARWTMRPIKQLTAATARIADGDFDVRLPTATPDEIGRLTRSFDVMTRKLRQANDELREWNRTLEQKVDQRTEELRKAHERMLTAEKLASLGQLSAMVAHEINNPLSGVLSYIKLSGKLLGTKEPTAERDKSIVGYLDLSAGEVKRCGEIVRNLLTFARRSFGEYSEGRLHNVIDKSIALIKHSLDVNNVELIREYDSEDDTLQCDQSGVQQMVIALMVNANEAMDKGGKLIVRTDGSSSEDVGFQIIDTGKGIPHDVLGKIFEPFFTTKDQQKGTGLGLSVVYGIVQSHHGTISVESVIDKGTTFNVRLPRKLDLDQQNQPAESAPPTDTQDRSS